ncbi:MAG: type IV-A pilus assembly ATPase PilB [Candidatus Zixiibacteriota bacterium]
MKADLGTMLVEAGKITKEQHASAQSYQDSGKGKFEEGLIDCGAVESIDEVYQFVGKQLNMGAMRLSDVELNPEIVRLVPLDIARKFNVIAISKIGRNLVVAISDPNNIYVLDAVKFITGCNIQPVISPEDAISKAIDTFYSSTSSFADAIKDLDEDVDLEVVTGEEDGPSESELLSAIQDKPLVKLVDSIITDAVRRGASDIHVENYEKRLRVRYRVDGDLREMDPLPFRYRAAIISRIKIMADLDISERRLPQDGRIKIKIGGRPVDLRVSSLPTIFGEKVVMRILDQQSLRTDLSQLGFHDFALQRFKEAISLPYGIILVTGPTGSGKTTTLYSGLKQLNHPDVNIMTAEDPVEFNFDGINQVLVRTEIGMTFAAALRSFLRQDPDIIMVGEIRDGETAEIAIRAALTGHLVFSTLHTNDAPSSINRLIDMGIPSFLVASSARLIMAQRMTRKMCQSCKEELQLTDDQLSLLTVPDNWKKKMVGYRAKGCSTCGNTGKSGRTGIYEVMPISPTIESLILDKATDQQIRDQAIREGMFTLQMAAVDKMQQGILSIDEVFAVTI